MDCNHQCPMFDTELAKKMTATLQAVNDGLIEVRTEFKEMKKTLLGNGRPGLCQIHTESIEDIRLGLAEEKGRRDVEVKEAIDAGQTRRTLIAAGISAFVSMCIAAFGWLLKGR